MTTQSPEMAAAVERVRMAVCEHILMPQRCGCGADWECAHIFTALADALRLAKAEGAYDALTRMPCSANWEDERACTFADISLEEACQRCWRKDEAKQLLAAARAAIGAG